MQIPQKTSIKISKESNLLTECKWDHAQNEKEKREKKGNGEKNEQEEENGEEE